MRFILKICPTFVGTNLIASISRNFYFIFYRLTNGSSGSGNGSGNNNTAVLWMMGTSLNTSSSAAREMDMVLKSEISAHSAYDPATKPGNHGVPVPGKKQVRLKIFIIFRI